MGFLLIAIGISLIWISLDLKGALSNEHTGHPSAKIQIADVPLARHRILHANVTDGVKSKR
jgi:hypothetical protein